jgi:hypothetical protein
MLIRLGRGFAALRSALASASQPVLSNEEGTLPLAAQDGRLLSLE